MKNMEHGQHNAQNYGLVAGQDSKQHCGINGGGHGCKTRRYTYSIVGVIGLLGLATALIVPHMADAADENPIQQTAPAPELKGSNAINAGADGTIRLSSHRGKVTIVHFWTFGCINCKRNLPAYQKWQKDLAGQNVDIISVHTPETSEEESLVNVRQAVKRNGITYPVLVDTDHTNWNRWNVRYWPSIFLVDKHGKIRYRWEGELEYGGAGGTAKMERLVKELQSEK